MTATQAWTGLADLADQAVVLPLALLVFLALRQAGARAGLATAARAWALSVGGVLLALLVLKLWAGPCGGAGLRSPSGHAAAGGIVYGGLLALSLRRGPAVSALCCLAAASVFGASRLALGVHTSPEVALACAVATAGGAALARLAGWPGDPAPRAAAVRGSGAWAWGAAALGLVWVLHGRRLPAEPVIRAMAAAWLAPLCGG